MIQTHPLVYFAIFLAVGAVVILKVGGLAINWAADHESTDSSL